MPRHREAPAADKTTGAFRKTDATDQPSATLQPEPEGRAPEWTSERASRKVSVYLDPELAAEVRRAAAAGAVEPGTWLRHQCARALGVGLVPEDRGRERVDVRLQPRLLRAIETEAGWPLDGWVAAAARLGVQRG